MNNIFDSHAHYTDSAFDTDRKSLLVSLAETGICGIINCGTDIEDSEKSLELANEYRFIYAASGVHPHEAGEAPENYIEALKQLLTDEKAVAIGEIGLDYHYDFAPREVQQKVFREQLELARELCLPVIIHDREAHADTLTLLKEYKPKGVVHCFSGSVETAREILSLGMYIGLGGAVTFKNAQRPCEVAAFVPDDRLLIETDCPYMTPVPYRGKRCDSSFIPITAEKIAQLRQTGTDKILELTAKNARMLFNL